MGAKKLPPLRDTPEYRELQQMLAEQKARGGRLPTDEDLHAMDRFHVTGSSTLVTMPEAAKELRLSVQRVRVLARTGRLVGARKLGRDWLIPSPVVVNPPLQIKHGSKRARSDF
jgi:phage baseplate assembly protein gpV